MSRENPESRQIVKLHQTHGIEAFDCDQNSLIQYFKRYALMSQRGNGAQTYVGLCGDKLIGYHTLVVGEVAYQDNYPIHC